MEQNPSDGFLIEQYREGDTAVLPVLVERYHQTFCQKAYWVLKDKEAAKDVAQEAWMTIIGKLDTLQNVDSFKSWAMRIVYTKAIDAVKDQRKTVQQLRSIAVSDSDKPSGVQDKEQIQIALLKAIQELSVDKQDVIRLFYTEAYSIIEISDFLKVPIGTVKSRLFKAREKLKSIIKTTNHEK